MADPDLKSRIQRALEHELSGSLGQADVHVFDGYGDNIHVWVASSAFRGVPEHIRQDTVFDVLSRELAADELVVISLILTFDPEEPEYGWALREQELASK